MQRYGGLEASYLTAMKFVTAVCLLSITVASCKLMPHEEEKQKKTKTAKMSNEFKAPEWAHTTNIYEVNLRQYTREGTINAFAASLPRLKAMGVQTLWFMPITPIAEEHKKGVLGSYYACSDYTAVSPEFGTLDDFRKLVNDAHEMGFKVILDWVANHTGWGHRWTKEHPEYYLHDSATNNFKIASGMDDIIELNYSNPATVDAMIEAMKFWVKETGIDGFRCDLASWVELPFWQKARAAVDSLKPLFWLGEFDELENPDYGKVFDASYSWTWMHKTKDFFQQKQPLAELDSLLKRYSAIGDHSMRAWFTTNHDENSWNGTEYMKYGPMAKPLAVFSATWNGVPLIYSGQELPNLDSLAFFEKDVIKWNGRFELQDFYKTLFQLHATNPALRGGDSACQTIRIKTNDDAHIFAYLRRNGEHEVLVVLNMSYEGPVKVSMNDVSGNFKEAFDGSEAAINSSFTVTLDPWGYKLYVK
jgi:alpha-amylase